MECQPSVSGAKKHQSAIYAATIKRPRSKLSEHARMGLFDAAAFAWMYFHDIGGERQAA
jgi:hypothetical protein